MATYSVYDNILIKLENVFMKVEMDVDKEQSELLSEHLRLNFQLSDLKSKIDILNSLKRSYDLHSEDSGEIEKLRKNIFKALCDKQLQLRFIQEKELLLTYYSRSQLLQDLPTVIQINREFRLRKSLLEIELLAKFLADDKRFAEFYHELERANEIFDLAVESGANDKLENALSLFQRFFEKVCHFFNLESSLVEEFKQFKTQISLQANSVLGLTAKDLDSLEAFSYVYQDIANKRISLELETDKLFYQYSMFQNGKSIIQAEIKNTHGELESILFKEYAIKQKMKELKQYKIELNHQKEDFMKDPTVDGYAEAMRQLEQVETRFRRLMMHKNFEKPSLVSRFFAVNRTKKIKKNERTYYNKNLFQILHNSRVTTQDKMIILRLSKPSKVINTSTGKLFYQRTNKLRSLKSLEQTISSLQSKNLH